MIWSEPGAAAEAADPSGPAHIRRRIEEVPPLPIHTRWALLIGAGGLLDGFTTLTVAVALTVLVPALHLDFGQVGLLISAAFIGMFLGALGAGAASERFGRRTVFVACVSLFGTLSLLGAAAWDFESLFVARVIQGLGLGGAVPVGAALVAELLPASARGRTFGLGYGLLFSLGYVLAPLVGFLFIAGLGPGAGWRGLFLFAGLALPFGIALRWALPESPRWLASRGRSAEAAATVDRLHAAAMARGVPLVPVRPTAPGLVPKGRLTEIFTRAHRGRLLLVWWLFFVIYFVQYGLTSWLPTLYVQKGHIDAPFALILALLTGMATIAAAVGFALTVDRIGRRAWLRVGFGLTTVGLIAGMVAVGPLGLTSWPALFVPALVIAVGGSVNSGLIYLYAPELFPTRMRSWATSTGSAASRLGSIAAPLLIGVLLQVGAGTGLTLVFGALALASVLGFAALSLFGVETAQRPLDDIAH